MIKLTNEEYIEFCSNVHSGKYDYSLVNYINSRSKVKIICPEHGVFEQNAKNHKSGQGCKYCSGKSKITTDLFIKESKKIYGDRYDYSLVEYKGIKTKVKLIDLERGFIIEQLPEHHLNGRVSIKMNNDIFIKKAKKVHGDKYDYSLIDYKNSTDKISIKCNEYGFIFEQSPRRHLEGYGYGKVTREIFVKKCEKLHGGVYNYDLVNDIDSNKQKVNIMCGVHGVFEQSVNNHMNNLQGCPECKVISKGEVKISEILRNTNIKYIKEYKFDDCVYKNQKLRFDFYLPDYNICIEYDGRQHYEVIEYYGGVESLKKRKKRDIIKNKYCEENNIYLIRIPYYDFNKVEEIIKKEIIK